MKKNAKALTIANRLYDTQDTNLADAFKKAWEITRQGKLITNVSGVTFENRQRALGRLERYEPENINVTLERDKWNGRDSNAIKVNVSVNGGREYHLGYIPRNLAALAAALMDKGGELEARFKTVTGGNEGKSYGALITIKI